MCHFGDLAGNLLDCCILFFGGGLEGGAAVLPAQMELKFLEFLMAHRMSKQCLMNEQPNVPLVNVSSGVTGKYMVSILETFLLTVRQILTNYQS